MPNASACCHDKEKKRVQIRRFFWSIGLVAVSLSVGGIISCSGPRRFFADWTGLDRGAPANSGFRWEETHYPRVSAPMPTIPDAVFVKDDELCMTCHEGIYKSHRTDIHYVQSCEECHGPASRHLKGRGKVPDTILSFKKLQPLQAAEVCLKCHEQDACTAGAQWRTSVHAQRGVTCTDCHKAHYNLPPGTPATAIADNPTPLSQIQLAALQDAKKKDQADVKAIRAASQFLGAANPQTCYRCHQEKADLERVASPHQINGANGFKCQTCHNPHDQIRRETRTDVCLKCHQGHSPVMAWQSSIHATTDVACTDCHNPHPRSNVPEIVDITHTHIDRPKRLPMSVDEPRVCYRCHEKIEGVFSLPYHHPLPEGKMVCSSCHDAHGQAKDNLKEELVNLVCYKCHAEKQGPFVFEHPPVTENCAICHNPHGSMDKGMVHQPTPFLCLRCHTGHHGDDTTLIDPTVPGRSRAFQIGLYTNCTQCHAQIHGTNRISNSGLGHFTR
jgi:DmsE family decaheme c-type cytochrome